MNTFLITPVLRDVGGRFIIEKFSVFEATKLEGRIIGYEWLADFKNEDDANDYQAFKEARNATPPR